MEPRAVDFLRRLLDAVGPAGYEEAPAKVWRDEAATFADDVTSDVLGNSYARVNGTDGDPNGPAVIFVGHIDEIGFVIRHIDDEGYLWFGPIGGWDTEVILGQRVRIAGERGETIGLIGKKAAHLLKKEDRDKPTELRDVWIDIGARDRADALTKVGIGDVAVLRQDFVRLTDDLCASRCMDNRVGAFLALEAARLLSTERPQLSVIAVASTQEETSYGGAEVAAFALTPKVAIALDLTHPTDYPGADKKANDKVRVGGGPVLSRGVTMNSKVFLELRAASQRLDFDCAVQGSGASSGTDADGMIRAGAGVATGLVSVPARYMHSPNEVLSLSDVEQASRLLAEFTRGVTADTDYRP
ncbi:MAG: M20/M25/M40 family metallo-hydrolase [Chloroflexia bacterium]|nr:M20/M25/M40 family metallo-hydrolase [Chloroflexia bacterium]